MIVEDLRRFLVVARTSNVTEAAEILGLPQSTVSRAVIRLEEEYGFPLFDRIGRRVQLNLQGEALREHAVHAIEQLDAASESIAGARDPDRGVVQLGFLNSLATWLIPDLLRGFRSTRPLVDFVLRQDGPEALVEAVNDRHVHVALVSPMPQDRGLNWAKLHTEQLCVTLPSDHPLAGRDRVRLAEVESEPLILLRPATSIRETVAGLAARAGLRLNLSIRDDHVNTLRALVVAGIGLTVSPIPIGHPQAFAERGLVDIPLEDEGATRDVGITWHRQVRLPAVVGRFIDYAVEYQSA
jgi:LysR family transcriptional activator of glutamate synthase operon